MSILGSKLVARNQSDMKVRCWTYQSYCRHYRKTKMMWFCWNFGVLRSGGPKKDRGAMLAGRESVNLFFSHVRESSFISRSVIQIMMFMLWEGGREWTTLIISSEIWSFSFSFIPIPYIYTPPPPFWGYARTLSPSFAPPAPENLHSVRSCP